MRVGMRLKGPAAEPIPDFRPPGVWGLGETSSGKVGLCLQGVQRGGGRGGLCCGPCSLGSVDSALAACLRAGEPQRRGRCGPMAGRAWPRVCQGAAGMSRVASCSAPPPTASGAGPALRDGEGLGAGSGRRQLPLRLDTRPRRAGACLAGSSGVSTADELTLVGELEVTCAD